MATIAERIAAAEARKAAAEALLTDADRVEAQDRAKLAQLEAEEAAARMAALRLEIARQVDAAREAKPRRLDEFIPDGADVAFVVGAGTAREYSAWERDVATASKRVDATRAFAAACVVAWREPSGAWVSDWSDSDAGHRLESYLRHNPGVATGVSNVGARLSGLMADERSKSG